MILLRMVAHGDASKRSLLVKYSSGNVGQSMGFSKMNGFEISKSSVRIRSPASQLMGHSAEGFPSAWIFFRFETPLRPATESAVNWRENAKNKRSRSSPGSGDRLKFAGSCKPLAGCLHKKVNRRAKYD